MVKTRVILWTAPRSVSTAFERSIRTLKNGKVFHEPFTKAFFIGPERQSTRYASREIDPQATYRAISELIQKEYDETDFVFAKEMAYSVVNKFDIFLEEGFKNVKHSFLIRNPLRTVHSKFKVSTDPKLAEFDLFDPAEMGFRPLLELYEFLERHIDKDPVVVDADDLLDFPNETMQSYCEAVGLEYEEHMTTWEPGPVADWEMCGGWHDAALKSSGLIPRSKEKKAQVLRVEDLPPELAGAVEECTPYYEALRARKIHPRKTA